MHQFDDDVLECFLENQLQLFPAKVAETLEEAEDFLEESMAVVVDSVEEVIEYFEEEGIDTEGAMDDEILDADEVFDIGDGRYLIVGAEALSARNCREGNTYFERDTGDLSVSLFLTYSCIREERQAAFLISSRREQGTKSFP